MKKKELTQEQLNKVITLRQIGTSWLKIQHETKINRRTAKRAYEKWQHSKSSEELKEARKDVAVQEFRTHLDCLIKLAQSLVNVLDTPQPARHPITAEQVLLNLWQTDIVGEYGVYGLPKSGGYRLEGGRTTYPAETYLRQNLMLFKSLKVHTHEKVDWRALKEWEDAWDRCTGLQHQLQEETSKMSLNILKQKPGLTDRLTKGSGKKDLIERMVDGTLHAVWETILVGKPAQPHLIQAISRSDGMTDVVFGEHRLGLGLIFTEASEAKVVEDTCIWVANNLRIVREENMVELVHTVNTMRKGIGELTERLNLLILGPLILNTRCDLCPA